MKTYKLKKLLTKMSPSRHQDLNKKKIDFYLKIKKIISNESIITGLDAFSILLKSYSIFSSNKKLEAIAVGLSDIIELTDGFNSIISRAIDAMYYSSGAKKSDILTSLHDYVVQVVNKFDFKKTTIKTSDNNSAIIYAIDDFNIIVKYDSQDKNYCDVFILSNDIQKIENLIISLIFKLFNYNHLRIRSVNQGISFYSCDRAAGESDKISIEQDCLSTNNPSTNCNREIQAIKQFLNKGKKRSIIYYGPPGTGKTTIVNNIVENLGLKSVRFFISDIQHNQINVGFLVSHIKPDVIIIDDIDRLEGQTSSPLLTLIEELRNNCKLLLLTCNSIHFDSAIIRPGRVDQLVPIFELDEEVVKNVLGEQLIDMFDKVKNWPIAYVSELKDRAEVLGLEAAYESISELLDRVDRLNSQYDLDIHNFNMEAQPQKQKATSWAKRSFR